MSPRRSVRASGKTVDEAIARALSELGVEREEANIEIITEGSRGVLGFGAEEAEVEVSVEAPAPEPEAVSPEEGEAGPAEQPPARAQQSETAATPQQEEVAEVAREVLATLLEKMGMSATISVTQGDSLEDEEGPPPILLDVKGRDLGILIGRRGETLRDLQFMTRLIVNRRLGYWPNLVVDVESYKARRKKMLTGLALRMAAKVVETGHTVTLEPMPAYERRLIHIALRDHPQVTTQSTGEGESRKVMILLKT